MTLPKAGHLALRNQVLTLQQVIGDYMTFDKKL
jgi:hypothetical protein